MKNKNFKLLLAVLVILCLSIILIIVNTTAGVDTKSQVLDDTFTILGILTGSVATLLATKYMDDRRDDNDKKH